MKKIDGIVFDIDGTLFDSIEFNYRCLSYTIKELGYDFEITKEQIKNNLGKPQKEFFSSIIPPAYSNNTDIIKEKNRENFSIIMPKYPLLFSGVIDTLKDLREKGYSLFLYSNCSVKYLESFLNVFELRKHFTYIECHGHNNLTKKEILAKIKERYGENLAVVGDRDDDMKAAVDNGLTAVWAGYGFGEKTELHTLEIDEFIELNKIFL